MKLSLNLPISVIILLQAFRGSNFCVGATSTIIETSPEQEVTVGSIKGVGKSDFL